jgi:hypothetical protein
MIHPGSLYYCLSTMQSLKPDAPQFSDIVLQKLAREELDRINANKLCGEDHFFRTDKMDDFYVKYVLWNCDIAWLRFALRTVSSMCLCPMCDCRVVSKSAWLPTAEDGLRKNDPAPRVWPAACKSIYLSCQHHFFAVSCSPIAYYVRLLLL